MGIAFTLWRSHATKRADALGIERWRTNVERDIDNLKSYTARIETELKTHRKICEDRKALEGKLRKG